MMLPCSYKPYEWMAIACFDAMGFFLGFLSLLYEILCTYPLLVLLAFLPVLIFIGIRKHKESSNG